MMIWSVNLNPNRLDPDFSLAGLESASEAAFRHIHALGATGVRVDLFWRWLVPEPGTVNAEALGWYRRFFAECDRRGLTVFPLLYHPPEWALALGDAGFLTAWAEFCRLVARELGSFRLVQIWNEPNNFLAPLKADPALFHQWRLGPVNVPVGVRWRTLASLFAIARDTLAPGTQLVYNVLANLSPFLPFRGTWLDWEAFTDRFLAIAGDHVDVIALDHYPDTWAPGTGPLEWSCLDIAARKVADPHSPWHGKTVIVGETGYSSAPNFHLIERPLKLGRFFPGERGEETMAAWFSHAMAHLANALPARGDLAMVNVYELFDAPRPVGAHPILRLEDSFGLVRRDGTRKPAFSALAGVIRGERPLTPPERAERAVPRSTFQVPR